MNIRFELYPSSSISDDIYCRGTDLNRLYTYIIRIMMIECHLYMRKNEAHAIVNTYVT